MVKWFYKLVLFIAVITVMGHTLVPHHHAANPVKPGRHGHHHHHGSAQIHHHDNDEKQDSKSGSEESQNHPDEFGKHIAKRTYFNIELPEQVIEHLDFFVAFNPVSFLKLPVLPPPIYTSSYPGSVLRHSLSHRGPPAEA
jgi:hypothetical protein